MFLPCLINILQKFLQEHITAISWATLGAVQGYHASTNSPGSTTPHITPSQHEVARRQAAPPCHSRYMYIYIYKCVCVCVYDIYINQEPGMLKCWETLKQCKRWNVKTTPHIPAQPQ
jgi:hypothetical protein